MATPLHPGLAHPGLWKKKTTMRSLKREEQRKKVWLIWKRKYDDTICAIRTTLCNLLEGSLRGSVRFWSHNDRGVVVVFFFSPVLFFLHQHNSGPVSFSEILHLGMSLFFYLKQRSKSKQSAYFPLLIFLTQDAQPKQMLAFPRPLVPNQQEIPFPERPRYDLLG